MRLPEEAGWSVSTPVIAVLLRQRCRLAWNRATRGQRRVRNMLGSVTAILFTAGFVVLAGLNTGQVIDCQR